jgi:hypothetical protein
VPGSDLESGDAGGAPARGEIVEIDTSAIGGIEEGPEARRTEGGAQTEIGESLQDVGETFITAVAGAGADPQNSTAAAGIPGNERGSGPALFREDLRGFRDVKFVQLDGLLPDDGELGAVNILDVDDGDGVASGAEAEGLGGCGLALENQKCALFDAFGEVSGAVAPGRRTSMSAESGDVGWKPTDERICCQGPGSAGRTEKVVVTEDGADAGVTVAAGREAAKRARQMIALVSEGIPESGADVVEIGLADTVLGDGVGTVHDIDGEHE